MKKLLLTLMLAVLMLPFALQAQNTQTFDFEDNALPADWTNDTIHPWVVTNTSEGSGHSGTYCIKSGNAGVSSSTSTISATFIFAGDGSISFLAGIYGEGTSSVWDKCIFKIDGEQQFSYGALATWATYSYEVDAGIHTFEWTYSKDGSVNPTGDAFYLDDIVLDLGVASSCPRPLAVALGTITDNSIDITWTPGGSEAAWNVYIYDENGDLLPGYPDNTSIAEYSFTGLEANTTYMIGVKADCGSELSAERSVSAHTACEAVSNFPWSENFESYTANSNGVTFSDPCWVNEHISGTGTYFFEVYSSTSATGGNSTKMLRLRDMSSGTMTKLVLPLMDLPADNYAFSLDVYRNSSSANYGEGIRVYASSNGDIDGATELAFISRSYTTSDGNNIPAETESGWYTYTLPIGMSGNCYIILRGESLYGSSTYMDNFVVDEGPTCIPVTALTVDSITNNSVFLSWADDINSGATYTVYDMSDSSVIASGISDLTYTVEYLNANTAYTFGVAADCGGEDLSVVRSVNIRTECDVIATLPWTEDFEAVPSGSYQMPYCWNRYVSAHTSSSIYPYSYSSSTYAHSGSRSLYVYGTTDSSYPDTMAAILPELDVTAYPMNLNRVIFWARMSSTSYDKNVYVCTMSDPTDLTTLTLVDSVTVSGVTHTKYTVNLDNAPSTDAYVVLAVMKGEGSLYIDDLTLGVIPACPEVEALTVSAITADGATLSWTGNADGYTIYDMSDNSVIGNADDVTFTIAGLNPMTNYTIGVAANCGSDESVIVTVSFNTACTAIAVPYTETFEANSASSACWTSEGANEWTIGTGDYSTSTGAYQGSQNALITHVSTGDVTKLISPALDGVENGLILNFAYVMRQWVSDIDELRVYTLSSADAAWQQVAEYTAAAESWTPVSLTIPGAVYQIAFEYTDNYGYGVGLDNVALIPMDGDYCFPVSNIAVSGVTSNSVSLTWQENGDATAWSVAYGPAGFTLDDNADIVTVTDTTVTIDNLATAQSYDFYVQADCGGSVSEWRGPVQAAPGSFIFDVTGSSSITACGLVIYDNGGPDGNYSNDCDYTLTIYPSDPDSVVSVSGTFAGEGTADYLSVYDGTSTSGTLLQKITSGTSGTVINFGPLSSESGPVTLYFHSDYSVVYPGFEAFVSCVAAPDCRTPYGLTASNITSDEATISWTADEDANIELYYKEHSDSVYTTVTASEFTDANSYLMTNLDPTTTYDVYVANICTDDTLASATITFTTLCTAEIAPYSEDFAGFNTNISPCWGKYSGLVSTVFNGGALTSTTSGWNFTSSNVFPTGHPKLNIYGTSCNYWLVSPSIDLSQLTNPTLMFSLALTDYNNADPIEQMGNQPDDKFMVIISTDNGSTWSAANATIWDNAGTGNRSYDSISTTGEEVVISLSQYAGQTIRIAFYGESTVSGGDNDLHIADVVVGEPVTCPRPNQLTATGATTSSVTLSWTPGAEETAWDIIYGTPGFDVATAGTLIQNVTTNPYDVTGLDAGTAYEFYVRANCGGGDVSYWSNSVIFTTQVCDVADQCSYTFVLTDSYGDGWNGGSLAVEQNNVVVATLTLGSGESTATETVSLCDNVSTSLVWTSGSYAYEAGFSMAGPDGTVLFSHDSMDTYTTYTFTTDCSGSGPVVTDPTVATVAASAIAQTTATLNATITNPDNVTITAKGFEWKATTGGSYTQIAGTGTGNTFTANLTGLTPNTGYTYKAFITYNGTTVYGTEMTFTTLEQGVEPCDVPTGLTASNITKESFDVTWNNNASVSNWNIRYRQQNGQWTSATSSTNQYSVTGLAAETIYEVQVQANCGDNNLSEWSELLTVTTLVDGINSYLLNSISLYPNPANDYINVQCSTFNVQSVEVIDAYGKVINTVNMIDNPARINVSGLANGIYFVRVTTDEGVATKTFVKK
ncbi:MAG: fibronectin type III domain-containing protein [Bacteroidales bacterium]|nr:fibronectin type III domain-containing protein [Bacteroidales bacterium]